ncbi:Hypothetical predicted protein [Podarcis lilfordi]|uniref:Chromo domain-containing protein n=1 Tax=Podarcis lilfordi TaxID=74358 RepID=A0AA35LMZ0_9SAUR|nr:Hypothetical predicted protein [Podarcis lilfordi]
MVEDLEEFEIQQILDLRFCRRQLLYLVSWKGYGPAKNSWVQSQDLHAPDLQRQFHRMYPHEPKPRGWGEENNLSKEEDDKERDTGWELVLREPSVAGSEAVKEAGLRERGDRLPVEPQTRRKRDFLGKRKSVFSRVNGGATGHGSPPKPLWRETRGSGSQRSRLQIARPSGNSVTGAKRTAGGESRHREAIVSPSRTQPQACRASDRFSKARNLSRIWITIGIHKRKALEKREKKEVSFVCNQRTTQDYERSAEGRLVTRQAV